MHKLRVGNGTKVWVEVIGKIILHFYLDRILVLENFLYVLIFKQNLTSISKLMDYSYYVSFHYSVTISRMEILFVPETCIVTYFILDPISHQINNIEIEPTNKKRKIVTNYSYLWQLDWAILILIGFRGLSIMGP
jgi:hypothetical protein